MPVAAACVMLFIFSVFCEMSCGTSYGIVPFMNEEHPEDNVLTSPWPKSGVGQPTTLCDAGCHELVAARAVGRLVPEAQQRNSMCSADATSLMGFSRLPALRRRSARGGC